MSERRALPLSRDSVPSSSSCEEAVSGFGMDVR
jgi:hypothetical protein